MLCADNIQVIDGSAPFGTFRRSGNPIDGLQQLIVNPGSVGLQAYDDHAQIKHYMETHAPHASYATLEQGQSGWDVSLYRVSYNWDKAGKQASNLNREDWARGIATGRMV